MSVENIVQIYTDGACSGNPGPGGWGAVLLYKDTSKDLNGYEDSTTNNRMELKAPIEALKSLKRDIKIEIYTDSQYVKNGITTWIHNWKKNGWMTSAKKPVKNVDLWQELDDLSQQHDIDWHWVKGHSGHPENDRADALARNAIIRFNIENAS